MAMDPQSERDLIDEGAVVGGGEDTGGLLDEMRGTSVGTQDPNIVGDVGPTDIPPGPEDTAVPGPEDNDAPGPLGGDADGGA